MASVRIHNPPPLQSSKEAGRGGADRRLETARWTFLSNHACVLIELHANPDQVLREVATKVGITERAVQRIVQELEEEGYLTRERVGRRNRYRLIAGRPLRHPLASRQTIDALVELLNSGAGAPDHARLKEPAVCPE